MSFSIATIMVEIANTGSETIKAFLADLLILFSRRSSSRTFLKEKKLKNPKNPKNPKLDVKIPKKPKKPKIPKYLIHDVFTIISLCYI
jgi:hypothetical protein